MPSRTECWRSTNPHLLRWTVLACAVLATGYCFVSLPAYAAPKARGSISEARGTVELFSHAFPDRGWRRANSGQDLYEGDFVRTGPGDSFAIVRLYSAAGQDTIQISSDTLLELPILTEPKSVETKLSEAFVELKEGVIRWLTGEEAEPEIQWPSAFNVRTPTAVAGGRMGGTDGVYPGGVRSWEVAMWHEDNETTIMAGEGAVHVESRWDDKTVALEKGQKVAGGIDEFGPAEPFSEEEWQEAVAGMPDGSAATGGCDDASGSWTQTNRTGSSTWVLTPTGGGSYKAEEQGLGSATGTATLSGKTLRIEFRTDHKNPYVGHYQWTLDANCTRGTGKVVHTGGPLKGRDYDCTVSRGD